MYTFFRFFFSFTVIPWLLLPALLFSYFYVMKKSYFQFLLIAVAGLICYSNTFTVPFQFDDVWNIAENRIIQNLENFTVNFTGYQYNPRRFIGYLTFALNYKIGALNAAGYHAVNLVIHLLNAFLVYYLASLTLRSRFYAPDTMRSAQLVPLFSALFFVAHPIQTQAVTYIVQRFTSLATMFYLLSVVLYVKGRQSAMRIEHGASANSLNGKSSVRYAPGPLLYALCSLSFAVLAMRTKEMAYTLPAVIILYEIIFLPPR